MSREATWPVARTLCTSIIAAALALGVWAFAPTEMPRGHPLILVLAVLAGIAAVGSGRLMRLGTAWLVLTAIATPALVLVPVYRPPVWIFPAAVLVLAGFFSNGVRERVPLYLSNRKTQKAVADLLPEGPERVFIDLGCGLGGIVAHVARTHPDAQVIGVETAPLSFLLAWLRIAVFGPANARVRFQNIWATDVSQADMVYAFLSPAPMARLNEKLRNEMKPGSTFVSNSFAVPGLQPSAVVGLDDGRQTQLLIWKM